MKGEEGGLPTVYIAGEEIDKELFAHHLGYWTGFILLLFVQHSLWCFLVYFNKSVVFSCAPIFHGCLLFSTPSTSQDATLCQLDPTAAIVKTYSAVSPMSKISHFKLESPFLPFHSSIKTESPFTQVINRLDWKTSWECHWQMWVSNITAVWLQREQQH